MTQYRKKPMVINAVRVTFGRTPIQFEFMGQVFTGSYEITGDLNAIGEQFIGIETLEGNMKLRSGDYLICGIQGEFYPCKADIFEASYEEVL